MHNRPNRRQELTQEQENPYLAKPEDFKVMTAAEAARMQTPGHRQNGDDRAELNKLLNDPRRPPHKQDVAS